MYFYLIILIIPLFGTMIGSILALFFKSINNKIESIMLGFASGVMVAASVWSLIIPAINRSSYLGVFSFVPVIIGFFLGVFLIFILNLNNFSNKNKKINNRKKNEKLKMAVLIHNIPEGLAVGVCIALALKEGSNVLMLEAFIFSVGIAIQNIPEGMIVSLPLDNFNKLEQIKGGFVSGIVEPIASVVALLLSSYIEVILPYFLSLAAGAMIFVVVNDLLTDSKNVKYSSYLAVSFSIGFSIMMVLDVVFG